MGFSKLYSSSDDSSIISVLNHARPLDPQHDEIIVLQRYDLAYRNLLKYKVRNCSVPRNIEERDYFRAGLVDKSVQFAVDDLIHKKKQQVGAFIFTALALLIISYPISLSPESSICPSLSPSSCHSTSYYLLFHFLLLLSSLSFLTQISFGLCFVHIVSRPYTEIDCCVSFNKYGRKFDGISTFFLYTGVVSLLSAVVCVGFQRSIGLGIVVLSLVIVCVLSITFAYVQTSLPLTRKQGERVRLFTAKYCQDNGILKEEYLDAIYGTEQELYQDVLSRSEQVKKS